LSEAPLWRGRVKNTAPKKPTTTPVPKTTASGRQSLSASRTRYIRQQQTSSCVFNYFSGKQLRQIARRDFDKNVQASALGVRSVSTRLASFASPAAAAAAATRAASD